MTTTIHLIRHGETDWNVQRRYQGQSDIPLNAVGLDQASGLPALLAEAGISAVIASPLSRALETARFITRGLELADPVTDPRLMERNCGQAEGLEDAEVVRLFPGRSGIPGYESDASLAERGLMALEQIARKHAGSVVAVVAHGGIIRAMLARLSRGEHANVAVGNCSAHTLDWDTAEEVSYRGEYAAAESFSAQ